MGVLNGVTVISSGTASPTKLAALAPAAGISPPSFQSSAKTMVFNGEKGRIVGLMAKIPPQDEKSSEIGGTSEVDNKAARDLLSILSKY